MKKIRMRLKNNPYDIVIAPNAIQSLGILLPGLKIGKDAVVITSAFIWRLHGKNVIAALKKGGCSVKVFLVPDGEKSKSAQSAFRLLEQIARFDVLKKVFIVAVGGGVIGDLAGFVASVYKRGVPYIQIPTTFLAQIDSAIGGKVAVDLPIGKNLVGAIYQPRLVLSDTNFLRTLPLRQLRNGMAEAVKYGVIYDKKLFTDLENNYAQVLALNGQVLERVVYACSRIKAAVVEQDEAETLSIRTILNFGHTIGHAIEAAGHYDIYQHGEAIALGMRAAADISVQLKIFSAQESQRLNDLLSAIGLPKRIKGVRLPDILAHMKHDKKFLASKNRFVLAKRIGEVKIVEGVNPSVILQSIKALMV